MRDYKRILTVQDISCVGQCSLTVALPVLSACGHETCVLPTAVLSTHTGGFGRPEIVRFSGELERFVEHWKKNDIAFDAVLVGYLGSTAAICAAEEILTTMLAPGGVGIVDPAMADNGRLYSGFPEDYPEKIRRLCRKADVVLPNLTEAAILSDQPWQDRTDETYGKALLDRLEMPRVILTGVGEDASGFLLREQGETRRYSHRRIPGSFSGTGDLFAATFTGLWLSGRGMYDSAVCAADFTCRCIRRTAAEPAHWYGLQFEPELPALTELCGQGGRNVEK